MGKKGKKKDKNTSTETLAIESDSVVSVSPEATSTEEFPITFERLTEHAEVDNSTDGTSSLEELDTTEASEEAVINTSSEDLTGTDTEAATTPNPTPIVETESPPTSTDNDRTTTSTSMTDTTTTSSEETSTDTTTTSSEETSTDTTTTSSEETSTDTTETTDTTSQHKKKISIKRVVITGMAVIVLGVIAYLGYNYFSAIIENEKAANTQTKNPQNEDAIKDNNGNDIIYDNNGNVIIDTTPSQQDAKNVLNQFYKKLKLDMQKYYIYVDKIEDIKYIYTTPLNQDGSQQLINFLCSTSKDGIINPKLYNMSYYVEEPLEITETTELNQMNQIVSYISSDCVIPMRCYTMDNQLKTLADLNGQNTVFMTDVQEYVDDSNEKYQIMQVVSSILGKYSSKIYMARQSDLEFNDTSCQSALFSYLMYNGNDYFQCKKHVEDQSITNANKIINQFENYSHQSQEEIQE